MIPSLKLTAALEGLAGLSWVQVGGSGRLSVIRKELHPGQWTGYTNSKDADYEAYITPKYKDGDYFQEAWEECASFPGLAGLVARSPSITASYISEAGVGKEEVWEGFRARVYAHESEHSLGVTLFHPIATGIRLKLLEGVMNEQFREYASEKEVEIKELTEEFLRDMEEDPQCQDLLKNFSEAKKTQIAYRGVTYKALEDDLYENLSLALRYGGQVLDSQ